MKKRLIATITILVIVSLSASAVADVYWAGGISSVWSNASNWTNGFPSNPGAGNTIVNPGGAFNPVVNTLGNTTNSGVYISIGGVTMSVVDGGRLDTASEFVTGVWGNSGTVTVSGGELNIGGLLNMGAGGYDGDVVVSGGTVTSLNLSINTTGGASMDISGTGKYITGIGQLGNINYWVTNGAITANGGLDTVHIDTTTDPTKVILTTAPDCTADPIPGDISGPGGVPDCHVDIYDVAALAKDWLTCSLVPQTACWE
jgi:hypothetical protein